MSDEFDALKKKAEDDKVQYELSLKALSEFKKNTESKRPGKRSSKIPGVKYKRITFELASEVRIALKVYAAQNYNKYIDTRQAHEHILSEYLKEKGMLQE